MNYPGYTNEEIATIVAYNISSYPEDARRRFRVEFKKDAPPRTTLIGWRKRFKNSLSLNEMKGLVTTQTDGFLLTNETK